MDAVQPGQGLICRSCGATLSEEVADLGLVPLSVEPVPAGDDLAGSAEAFPDLDRCHAGTIKLPGKRLDDPLCVGARLELRNLF